MRKRKKFIRVDEDVWEKLYKLKIEKRMKTISDVIRHLLKNG